VDVKLRLLASAPHPLKNRSRVHFHSYTMETVAEIVLHGTNRIAAGEESFARLKLPEAAFFLPGDHFIFRQFSPVITIGGGVVLDAAPIPRMRVDIEFLKILAGGDEELILKERIARRSHQGITMSRLIAETGWTRNSIQTRLTRSLQNGGVVRTGDLFLLRPVFQSLQSDTVTAAAEFHKKNPLVDGIGREELRAQVNATPEVFDAVASALVRERRLEVFGDLVRLPGQRVVMKDDEAESKKKIEDAFATAGLRVPGLNEVLGALKVDKSRAQKIVTLLLRDKLLIKISGELVFHRTALERLRRELALYKSKSSKIDVAHFKELTGVTRKYAIPLLEYLDREHVTRRVGDAREIL
jgi:selenocysteine-specific elongation factor